MDELISWSVDRSMSFLGPKAAALEYKSIFDLLI